MIVQQHRTVLANGKRMFVGRYWNASIRRSERLLFTHEIIPFHRAGPGVTLHEPPHVKRNMSEWFRVVYPISSGSSSIVISTSRGLLPWCGPTMPSASSESMSFPARACPTLKRRCTRSEEHTSEL